MCFARKVFRSLQFSRGKPQLLLEFHIVNSSKFTQFSVEKPQLLLEFHIVKLQAQKSRSDF